jgi:hypothetical protein
MTSARSIPLPALVLGAGGLIPFACLSILVVTGWSDALGVDGGSARRALLAYAAVIASFLGGIRWGAALRESGADAARDLILSVVPALLAWFCLALPRPWDSAAIGALLLAWGVVDQDLGRRALAPAWFGSLRLILSGSAGAAMLLAAFG